MNDVLELDGSLQIRPADDGQSVLLIVGQDFACKLPAKHAAMLGLTALKAAFAVAGQTAELESLSHFMSASEDLDNMIAKLLADD